MNIEEIKREYFKYHYENRENILPADIADWWIKKLQEAYTSGFNTAKERAKDIIYNGGVQIDDLITVEDKLHIVVENPKSSQIILLDGEVLEAINKI